MRNLSDEDLISRIQTRNIHLDAKSKDPHNPIVKRKYKLVGKILDFHPTLIFYPFFPLTSKPHACNPALTIVVERHQWEDLHEAHLRAERSYIDVGDVEPILRQDLLSKMRDNGNGMKKVAALPVVKFAELMQKKEVASKSDRMPTKQSVYIEAALHDGFIPQRVLENLIN